MVLKMIKTRYWTRKIVVVLLSLAFAGPAAAVNIHLGGGQKLDLSGFEIAHQETFESNRSPGTIFWGVLDVGQKADDPWTGMLTKDAYVLTHTGKPGAVRYYFRQRLDDASDYTLSEAAISVDVSGTMNGDISGAGLICGYNPKTKHYLAFVKGAGRSYAIYQRNAQGMRRIMAGTSNAVKPRQPNQLAIVPKGSGIIFYINGTQVAAIKDETASGGAGILAISSGMFLFDNFTLYKPSERNISPSNPVEDQKEAPTAPVAQLPSRTDEGTEITGEAIQTPVQAANPRQSNPAADQKDAAPEQASQLPPQADTRTVETEAASQAPAQAAEGRQAKLRAYKKVLKTGMSKQQVIQMFGQPAYLRGSSLFYRLGPGDNGDGGDYTLVIQFDENDNVSNYKAVQG